MKIILMTLLCLTLSISHADFRDAQENYNQKSYKQAFDEFLVLAKFGNIKSQHNVAVMYANGQGIKQDLIQAYAWSKISDSYQNYTDLTKAIKKQLPQNQLLKAEELTKEYYDQYAHVNSKVLLGPIFQKGELRSTKSRFKTIHREAPKYPKMMALNRIQGWVDVLFNVYPDGSVKDFHIIEEIPNEGLFAKAAIKSIEQYKFTAYENFKEPVPVTTRITFKMRGQPDDLTKKQQKYINNLIEKAKEGNLESQYSYAILFDTFLQKQGEIPGKQVNQWLFNVAQNGVTDAQYRLGKNMYYGNDCKVEKQKGLDWIMRAAQIGNADAEYMAYQMLQNNKSIINQSNQPPLYWLQQAAKNGSNIAQLKYAGEITKSNKPSLQELAIAEEYLDSYQKKFYKTIQWYQINAMVQNKLNNRKKALKSIKSAIKSAKKVGWDLTELEQQKHLIETQKS